MDLHNFYLDYQDELERGWNDHAEIEQLDIEDENLFWEFVADERDRAEAAAEGYL